MGTMRCTTTRRRPFTVWRVSKNGAQSLEWRIRRRSNWTKIFLILHFKHAAAAALYFIVCARERRFIYRRFLPYSNLRRVCVRSVREFTHVNDGGGRFHSKFSAHVGEQANTRLKLCKKGINYTAAAFLVRVILRWRI